MTTDQAEQLIKILSSIDANFSVFCLVIGGLFGMLVGTLMFRK